MKRKFRIVTDSACDMPTSFLEERDVLCIPLGFNMDDTNYGGENGEVIDAHVFYERLRAGSMPTTYQITAETAKTHIEPLLAAGEDVLAMIFSSGLSGTVGSFSVAARELSKKYPKRKIEVVDTLCCSMGVGMLIDYAVKKANAGADIEETKKYVEELKGSICHVFTVDDLFHLKRGGRVSTTTAVIGSILKIKPIMHMDDEGHLIVIGKAMGRKKAIHAIVNRFFEIANIGEDDPIYISHGDCPEDAEYVKQLVLERYPTAEIIINTISPVIGAHSGPNTLAVFGKATCR